MYTDYTSRHIERFWSKVDLSKVDVEFACWEWTAQTLSDGYGRIQWRNRALRAHRIAYLLAFGAFPIELDVCHHCDNPACVNPNHLFLGTDIDNVRDREMKGRNAPPRGEKHGRCKLSDVQVADIRQRHAEGGVSQRQLAREFGVHHRQIGRILRYENRSPSRSA